MRLVLRLCYSSTFLKFSSIFIVRCSFSIVLFFTSDIRISMQIQVLQGTFYLRSEFNSEIYLGKSIYCNSNCNKSTFISIGKSVFVPGDLIVLGEFFGPVYTVLYIVTGVQKAGENVSLLRCQLCNFIVICWVLGERYSYSTVKCV